MQKILIKSQFYHNKPNMIDNFDGGKNIKWLW